MNIIANDCTGAELYKLMGEQYKNPFIWNVIPLEDFITLYGGYDYINFNKVKYKETPNLYWSWPMSSLEIDNQVNVYYIHHQRTPGIKEPIIDINELKLNCLKVENMQDYLLDKYYSRMLRMTEEPIFIYDVNNLDNLEEILKFANVRTNYKLILITDNEEVAKIANGRIQVLLIKGNPLCIVKAQMLVSYFPNLFNIKEK